VCRECYTPLVRSPSPDRQLLCVKCNRDTTLTNGVHPSTSSGSEDILPPVNYHPVVDGDQMDSDEEEQEAGVMQDDPTAIPVLATECVLPATSLLTVVSRREQSDRASKLIGERLLQGYCLLDEICPTTTCYGVIFVLYWSNERSHYYDYQEKAYDDCALYVRRYILKYLSPHQLSFNLTQ